MRTKSFVLSILYAGLMLCHCGLATAANQHSPESREYHLKAAFLRYVAKFVEWPADAVTESKINICVLGQVPSFKGLQSIDGKIVNDHIIKIRKVAQIEDAAKSCQMIFITKTEEKQIPEITRALKNRPILSFGDMEGFASRGGAMNFYILNNRLAIMINPHIVKSAQLKISPRMLKVVTVAPKFNKEDTPSRA